jgi:hypothetical protein
LGEGEVFDSALRSIGADAEHQYPPSRRRSPSVASQEVVEVVVFSRTPAGADSADFAEQGHRIAVPSPNMKQPKTDSEHSSTRRRLARMMPRPWRRFKGR